MLQPMGLQRVGYDQATEQQTYRAHQVTKSALKESELRYGYYNERKKKKSQLTGPKMLMIYQPS